MGLLQFEYTFEMDDQTSDIEITSGMLDDEGVMEGKLITFLSEIRKEHWFNEGHRTEGVLTFGTIQSIELSYKSINMVVDEDGVDCDEIEEVDYVKVIETDFFK
jgi:hypothetical protein